MSNAAFDTLTIARDIEATGLKRAQAEAIATAIGAAGERAATKADIEISAKRLEDKVENCATRADIANLENRMLKVAVGIVVANTALTVGLLRLFGGG